MLNTLFTCAQMHKGSHHLYDDIDKNIEQSVRFDEFN